MLISSLDVATKQHLTISWTFENLDNHYQKQWMDVFRCKKRRLFVVIIIFCNFRCFSHFENCKSSLVANLHLDSQRVKEFLKSTNFNLQIHNTFYNSKKHHQIHLTIITGLRSEVANANSYHEHKPAKAHGWFSLCRWHLSGCPKRVWMQLFLAKLNSLHQSVKSTF